MKTSAQKFKMKHESHSVFDLFLLYIDQGVSVTANVLRIYVAPDLVAESKCCQ